MEHHYKTYDCEYAFDTYVICFSEHNKQDYNGVLSMWRGYGEHGSGAALVIDTNKIAPINESPLIMAPVHYATHDERKEWINNKLTAIAKWIQSETITDNLLNDVAFQWIERLKMFSLYSKHDGFREEKEWRIVYLRERDQNESLINRFNYSVTDNGAEPKLKLPIKPLEGVMSGDISFETIIDRIIIGPVSSTILSIQTVRRMLEIRKKERLRDKVYASTIPFRK